MDEQQPRKNKTESEDHDAGTRDKPTEECPTEAFVHDTAAQDPSIVISADSNFHSVETELLSPERFKASGAGDSLRDFQILEELGSGTFGVVYRARDLRLDREVAIKLIKDGQIGNKSRIENFRAEARAAAQLRHPNIVPVHQAGDIGGGQTFIVYEFIQGKTLRAHLRKKRQFDRDEAVAVLVRICDGLGYAHSVGIVHRDVKPENILIEESTSEPLVADFGCATRNTLQQNVDGSVLQNVYIGTPPYFSPEQASGRSHEADARSDVWALGVILEELITGKRTFRSSERSASHFTDLLKDIREVRPRPLRERADNIDRDLDAIWQKCLQAAPNERYSTAAELAEDLRRWQERRPVVARPIGPLERTSRWAARNPLVAASLSAVFVTVFVAFFVSLAFYLQEVKANHDRVRKGVELLLAEEPSELSRSIEELKSYDSIAPTILSSEWDELRPQLQANATPPATLKKLWRIAFGLFVLDAAPDEAREYFASELFSPSNSPEEFDAVVDVVTDQPSRIQQTLSNRAQQILSAENPSSQLRARWYRLKARHGVEAHLEAEKVADCLYDLAALRSKNVESWLKVLEPLHQQMKSALVSKLDTDSASHVDSGVVEDLIAQMEDQVAELIQLIADPRKSLALLSDRLKRCLEAQSAVLSFEELTEDVNLDDPHVEARLWLAYLHVADLEPAKTVVLRCADRKDRSAASWFINEVSNSAVRRSKLVRLAQIWYAAGDDRLADAVLAIGSCSGTVTEDLREWLIRVAEETPLGSVHAACKWALGVDVPNFDALEYGDRNWRYLPSPDPGSPESRLFIRLERPKEPVAVGTPARLLSIDPDRLNPEDTDNEILHRRKLTFPFEIAAEEVTCGQFEEYIEDRLGSVGDLPRLLQALNSLNQDRGKPAHEVTWHDAVEYCVWLSRRHNLESCYGPIEEIQIAFENVVSVACDRSKNGFRLPTNGEWELACRAATETLWPFGSSPKLADDYAVHLLLKGELAPVATLKPNQLGLFDMLGNAREWTDEISRPYPDGATIDEPTLRPADTSQISFDVRGGGFEDRPQNTRSGWRRSGQFSGFRVVRTLQDGGP